MTDAEATALRQQIQEVSAENLRLALELDVKRKHYALLLAGLREVGSMLEALGEAGKQG